MQVKLESFIQHYSWDTMGEGIIALSEWVRKDLITEAELASFLIQIVNQIPDALYNEAQSRLYLS